MSHFTSKPMSRQIEFGKVNPGTFIMRHDRIYMVLNESEGPYIRHTSAFGGSEDEQPEGTKIRFNTVSLCSGIREWVPSNEMVIPIQKIHVEYLV